MLGGLGSAFLRKLVYTCPPDAPAKPAALWRYFAFFFISANSSEGSTGT
jgi:hypothetical protein